MMKKHLSVGFFLASLLAGLLSGLLFHSVSAHQSVTVGNYEVEIGWLDEPPVVGQRNAIIVNIAQAGSTPTAAGVDGEKPKPIDISALKVQIAYGGETKTLDLQPLSEDSLDQYTAPILPMTAGKYTVRLSGTIGTSPASAEVQPEEVQPADSLQFPSAASAAAPSSGGLSSGLAVGALLLGAVALLLSVVNLLKKRG
jgi:hypothetical protein